MIFHHVDRSDGCIYNVYMTTKIKMWGNSLGVRIPKYVSEELCLREGNDVQVSLQGKIITIKPIKLAKSHKAISLKKLVSKITKHNRHGETDWGYPVGKELW